MRQPNSKRRRNEKSGMPRIMMLLFCIQLIQTRSPLVESFSPKVNRIRSVSLQSMQKNLLRSSNYPTAFDMQSGSGINGFHPKSDGDDAKSQSNAAEWHRQRRKRMIEKYGDQILPLEQQTSFNVGIPLLMAGNLILFGLCWLSSKLSLPWVFCLSLFPGSILSLWQLQILHDALHGSLAPTKAKKGNPVWGMGRTKWQNRILFWGSMPSVFGYYLYLKFGHLTHHSNLGDGGKVSLAKLFDSDQTNFEDGDILFVSHRMKLLGKIGPTFSGKLPSFLSFGNKNESDPEKRRYSLTMSLSRMGFDNWKMGKAIRNIGVFASSFLFERLMLVINDVAVSLSGFNAFFPNKPKAFHAACAKYARCATLVRLGLLWLGNWKSLLFLYLSETLWSIPPHPASAMFVTNHPSIMTQRDTIDGNTEWSCQPSQSTYLGQWYSLLTLGTNYHCEHHDFPTIPLHKLSLLHQIAPEFYPNSAQEAPDTSLWKIWKKSFSDPDFYACMNSNIIG